MNSLMTGTALTIPYPLQIPDVIEIRGGILNAHGHPRNPFPRDGRANMMAPLYDEVFEDLLGVGNTIEALTTVALAEAMKQEWQSLCQRTKIHILGLMTEETTAEEVMTGWDRPDGEEVWIGMKMFMRAVSNSHGKDVDNLDKVIPVIAAMNDVSRFRHKKRPMVLKMHCERKYTLLGREIPLGDRERMSFMRDVEYILTKVPHALIDIAHVSDGETIIAIRELRRKGFNVFGEISPHYTDMTIESLFDDGSGNTMLNTMRFCLPTFKSAKDKEIILQAMISGEPWWHYGDDGACWDSDWMLTGVPPPSDLVKVGPRGLVRGGQTQLPKATVSYVLEIFVLTGRAHFAQSFLVENGRRIYGLPIRDVVTRFEHKPWIVDDILETVCPETGRRVQCLVAMGKQERLFQPL